MDNWEKLVSGHPWKSLSTIKTFDIGDDSDDKTLGIKPKLPDTTENMDETTTEIIRKINIIGLLKAKASTPISLLVESLVQQLCSLLEPDSIKAHKLYNIICEKLFEMKLIDESYSMEEFEIMRSQYQRALYQLVGVAKGSEIPKTLQYPLPNGNNLQLDSRYKKEFLELCYLGGGGFGQVYKARHRLDGSEYAVKKICIYAGTVKAFMTHLKEVKTFAILNHPNVVQYKAAWLETLGNINGKNSTKESHSVFEDSNDTQIQFRSYIHRTTTKSIFESFIHLDNDKSDTSDSEIIFANSQSGDGSFHQNTPSFDTNETDDEDNSKQICRPSEIEDSITCTKSKREWVTLYIQMALCQLTLKEWLDERNKKERELMLHKSGCGDSSIKLHMEKRMGNVREIFKQLAAGLGYIHSKGIVHHDIKPSNIFISLDGDGLLVQLGDFGLACPLEKSHNGIALGTQLYAAPEQLSGKCDLKSDIFSLGIILLELIESFSTDMERVHNIMELRKGRLAAHISAEHPQLAHIMSQLVSKSPTQRPNATKLLSLLETDSNNLLNINYNLAQQLKDKDAEIARLQKLLSELNRK